MAANLHVHLHRPVLYGVYRCGVEGVSLFIEVNASGDKEVHALLQPIITRLTKPLTRQGLRVKDIGQT